MTQYIEWSDSSMMQKDIEKWCIENNFKRSLESRDDIQFTKFSYKSMHVVLNRYGETYKLVSTELYLTIRLILANPNIEQLSAFKNFVDTLE